MPSGVKSNDSGDKKSFLRTHKEVELDGYRILAVVAGGRVVPCSCQGVRGALSSIELPFASTHRLAPEESLAKQQHDLSKEHSPWLSETGRLLALE